MATPSKQVKHFLSPAKRFSLTSPSKKYSNFASQRFLTPNKPNELQKPSTEIIAKNILTVTTPNKQKILSKGLEKYNEFLVLGKGSFGVVIKGTYKGNTVAVKVIKSTDTSRESNALNLNHENITKTLQVLSEPNQLYFLVVMEYLKDWKSLQSLIESKVEFDFLGAAKEISEGLAYCHANEIMHLDLKPSNILVKDGKCKICDFGNSLKVNSGCENFEHKGTVLYTAPEILRGVIPTKKSDIYSLGLIFWQLRHCEELFTSILESEVLIYKVVKFDLRPTTKETYKDSFFDLYSLCWHKNPENRPTASEVLQQLTLL